MAFEKRVSSRNTSFVKLSQQEVQQELEDEANTNQQGSLNNECSGDQCQLKTDNTDRSQ